MIESIRCYDYTRTPTVNEIKLIKKISKRLLRQYTKDYFNYSVGVMSDLWESIILPEDSSSTASAKIAKREVGDAISMFRRMCTVVDVSIVEKSNTGFCFLVLGSLSDSESTTILFKTHKNVFESVDNNRRCFLIVAKNFAYVVVHSGENVLFVDNEVDFCDEDDGV